MKSSLLKTVALACAFTAVVSLLWHGIHYAAEPTAISPQTTAPAETAALKLEIERLKGIVPDQSHAMKDVAYHYSNLWFAAQKKNWPLAEFYWNETRSHLRWAMRIIPVRKDPQGREIRVADLLTGIEATALEELHNTIKDKNWTKFADAYQQMMASCQACHVAAGKPFLRLQIPTQPAEPLIQFEPAP